MNPKSTFSAACKGVPFQSDNRDGAPEGAPLQTPRETTLTRTGVKLGTAGYMSPEQVRGEPLDARTDIFSFGLVLYEMATGERAFTGETEAILHDAIQHREPKPVRELAPEITPTLEEVIGQCLEKEQSKRYQSATELRDALARERVQVPLVAPESRPQQTTASHSRRWVAAAILLVLVVSLLAGILYRRAHPSFKLTDKDTIVLADFENKTGDPVFDGGMTWALRIGLEQTPFLNVLAPDKVARVLAQIGHAQEPLTLERALDVCRQTNSRAVLIGTIADAGNQYGVALRAVRCDTVRVVAKSETTANERNQIVAELGRAAVDLRSKLGEPSATIQQFNKPLDHATSASVETLKLYTEALQRHEQKGPRTALADMLQATERDPSFAIAYRNLGNFYGNMNELSAMEYSLTKAFELRRQLTDRERLRIEGMYYELVTGEIDRAVDIWQSMIREYPTDEIPRNSLAWCLRVIGEPEQAAVAAREAIRVDPEFYAPYHNLMVSEIWMNRWAEAKAVYEEAHSRKVDSDSLHALRFRVAFLDRDRDGMQKELEWEKSDPSATGRLFVAEAGSQLYFGHAKLARTFLAQGVSKKLHTGLQESAALVRCEFAAYEGEIGEAVRAREDATAALAMFPTSREVKRCTSFVLALLGDAADAQRTATEIKREKPLGTVTSGLLIPALTGAALLAEGKPTEALKALEPSIPYFRYGDFEEGDGITPQYLRGIALLKLHRAPEAVVEFRKIIDHPGLVLWSVLGPLAHLQLARAYAMMGDKDAARKSYQDFLTLWKDADLDIPIYRQAKAEYAKLNKLPATSRKLQRRIRAISSVAIVRVEPTFRSASRRSIRTRAAVVIRSMTTAAHSHVDALDAALKRRSTRFRTTAGSEGPLYPRPEGYDLSYSFPIA
jgi:tetratricopeptide (TPR) repeat protein